ncbi:SubName: Full=Uncharacterized protein {ECO:0000313/EMBL:CCA71369.1} [Serendipita indica DSM 11827]|uniref:Uncharacterized protein n=1 Tax=Serendipita indica (strain DSM 11827) TaxID=1109443 RepID=G4TJ75_SERID|nr:SubName: Full=Uncharacterized protein {ECO:0000313/EMBL:CCA71369.1} [Serendipita indica DSM 11827]CCA71369.1 hypothetical protein PIIN_05308 [Serendipita indica DSM 11827]
MHLPGKKHTKPEISEPLDARPIEGEPHPQMLYNLGQTGNNDAVNPPVAGTHSTQLPPTTGQQPQNMHGLVHPHPDPAHVYNPNANQPAGAMDLNDPTRGVEAGQEPRVEVVEGKLPFKDQVRAYVKIHRGTVSGDHEQKELGKKILAGEVPPQ